MSNTHVPFERRFASPSEDRLRDPDYLSVWSRQGKGVFGWDELHEYRCVVVLGEGNCGKTYEFRQQHQRLRADGRFSFFVFLELLQDSDFLDAITAEEEHEFEVWSNETDKEAVFFLDAVDELILRKGTLRKALRKIKTALGPQAHRARFFVSCRPNDWNEELDIGAVVNLLAPREQKAEALEPPDGEKLFSAVFTREKSVESKQEGQQGDSDRPVKVLALLPLNRKEIVEFAKLYAPECSKAFETHLEKNELWHLYQLPAEIMSALDQLMVEGRLGNLEEQLVFGIGQKLREVSQKKRNELSEERAMEGAERIALALLLMKRRSIYLETPGGDSEGIGVADVLIDWSSQEQFELLGKGLFDPTVVGAVRFHHRSTEEFLAARRLKKLRESGLATADLFNLLFACVGGEQVVVPSMEPIAAWMALWDRDIEKEVKKRNPLLLFRQGIPALLNVELRADLIRRFVNRFAGSDWRRIGVGRQELKRIATSKLAPVVRELWDQAYTGHDTRELLLELIYLTPMSDCADLAFHAAFDEHLSYHHRTYAVWAVLECGSIEQIREVGASIINGGWPERVVRNVLPELFPRAIGMEDFLILAQLLEEVSGSVHGLSYSLLQIVKSDAVSHEQKVIIRNEFVQAIWENRTEGSRIYEAHSRYDHFVDAVIGACFATVPDDSKKTASWAHCLAVAFHFGRRRTSIIAKEETEKLIQLLSTSVFLREAFFWACIHLTDTLEEPENDWQRFIHSDYDKSLRPFNSIDFPWLLKALAPDEREEQRGVAFCALSTLVRDGNHPELAEHMFELLSDRADLSVELEKILNPAPRKPDKYDIEHRKWVREHEAKEIDRIEGWVRWREEVLADKEFLLSEAYRETTLFNLHKAIQLAEGENGTWGHWNSCFVETAFSTEFLERVRKELSRYWRLTDVQLYSERPEDLKNSHTASSLMALSAVKNSAEDPEWAKALTNKEAIQAVRIATLELNGFASFISQIEAIHPRAIDKVIAGEVQAQINDLCNGGRCPILHDILYHGTPVIQKSAASSLVANLSAIEALMSEETQNELTYAFEIIGLQGTADEVSEAIGVIQRYLSDSNHLTAKGRNSWIKVLAKLDLEMACENVLSSTVELSSESLREDGISLFAAIFGDLHRGRQINFDSLEPGRRLDLLHDLVIRAYQTIQPQDDAHHEGSYSPSTRDHAEEARGYLLGCLAATNSPRTLSGLYNLSSRPEFAHISDRLKQMATEVAGQISEPQAMNAVVFREFDQKRNYLPFDDRSLFVVMNNRLADFEHHLINDEQSTIGIVRKVETETALRGFISYWLTQNSREAYIVTQEAVVVSEKRTDIRLHSSRLDRYASIEVKLDDSCNKWSGTQLREALVDQLVGRYLNHERCQVGCLLICMREVRRWQNPDTKQRMDLKSTVAWLQKIAEGIMEERPGLFVSVKGIDYSATANERKQITPMVAS